MAENQTAEEWEEVDEWQWEWSPPPGDFLPPPPRPPFLEDDFVQPDGLTTCDLCTWARSELPGPPRLENNAASDANSQLSWTLTLVVVSLISALLGAIIMVTVIQCRNRIAGSSNQSQGFWCLGRRRQRRRNESGSRRRDGGNEASHLGEDPRSEGDKEMVPVRNGNKEGSSVWSWLTRRSPQSPAIATSVPSVPPVANHYTLDEAYTAVGEALYAELDRPAYQNTGYISESEPVSSAPSSAYYSDLSNTDRTYEIPAQTGLWEMVEVPPRRQPPRLASITETITVPSDYV
ncbi:uncharacterized protein LOC142329286 [Lycorma delicatula]|uniref:uncharacterized protein LOC142329286 n=1 Tax=Lycorma delicatula TaxID=130591 RepID=UPI003F51A3BF